jgi:DNA end-binding protein Ku
MIIGMWIVLTRLSRPREISFNQIDRKTGHRIKYAKVDADTGEEVANEDIMKGYKVDTNTYIEVSKDELEHIGLESTRTIDIDEFVPKVAIGRVVLANREHIIAQEPLDNGLMGTLLRYPYEVRDEKEYFDLAPKKWTGLSCF